MARQYPRFLFSDPQNTKSVGPFIVHNLFPRAIFKVIILNGSLSLQLLEVFESCTQDEERRLSVDALQWLRSQVSSRGVSLG